MNVFLDTEMLIYNFYKTKMIDEREIRENNFLKVMGHSLKKRMDIILDNYDYPSIELKDLITAIKDSGITVIELKKEDISIYSEITNYEINKDQDNLEFNFTTFDTIINITKVISTETEIKEAVQIIQCDGLNEIIQFAVEHGCINQEQGNYLSLDMKLFDNLDGINWEKNNDKYLCFLDAIGISEDVFSQYTKDCEVR